MENTPQKRTQKIISFKLQVVREIWNSSRFYDSKLVKKYGNFDYNYTVNRHKKMDKTLEQRVLEFEQALRLAKKKEQTCLEPKEMPLLFKI